MWILKFLPNWIFYGLLVGGVIGLIASRFIPSYYRTAVQAVCAAFFVIGVYMAGAISDNEQWLARVAEMEAKVAKAEEQSKEQNTKIETKVVNKIQIVKTRGENIVQYVDREVTKYDSQCVIPKEFVKAHNDAAEAPTK